MNKDTFIKEIEKLNITINEDILDKLDIYANFLIEYNKHTNLTAITNLEDIYLKHFYDSILIAKTYNFTNEKVLDIGTGAGFPGMIIKLFFPNIELTLLDSNNKKISFLKELSNRLNINDINIIQNRAEELNKKEYYDIVTSRAVSNLCILSEISLPLVKQNGYFIPLKGSNEEEIEEAKYAIDILGGKIENIYKFTLPIEQSNRNIIKIKKIKKTDNKYPRQYNQITKNPLKKKEK